MEWYKSLPVNIRIELKKMMEGICGVSWEALTLLGFNYFDKIKILEMKISQYFDL